MDCDETRGGGNERGGEDEPVRIPVTEEIDLHTFRPAEVRDLVADYLEEAARAGFRIVRIVHGKGTGVLRETVRSLLAAHPLVESFRDAPPEAGGFGATVAVLRSAERPTSGR